MAHPLPPRSQIGQTQPPRQQGSRGLRLPSLERLACKVGPRLAGTWEIGCREGLHHPLLRTAHCAYTIHANSAFMLNTCLSSESLGFGYMLGRGCLHDQLSVKTLGTEPLMSFPGRKHFTRYVTFAAGGMKGLLCDCTGQGLWKPGLVFL